MISHFLLFILSIAGLLGCCDSSDTWVVLVATSRYYFNYRHLSNVLAVYQIVKKFGVDDSKIILMNGFDDVCGTRNPFPGQVYGETTSQLDICAGAHSDYRGADVTVDAFLRLLTGRHYDGTPLSKRLNSNNESNVLIYLSGHGGDGFFKFRDVDEVSSDDIGSALAEMELKKRYRRLLLISDTCQAATLDDKISARRVASLASSGASENSYAYYPDAKLGVSLIDRFSFSLSEYFRLRVKTKADLQKQKMSDLIDFFDPRFLQSTPSFAMTAGFSDPSKIKLSWFFGSQNEKKNSFIVNDLQELTTNEAYIAETDNSRLDMLELESKTCADGDPQHGTTGPTDTDSAHLLLLRYLQRAYNGFHFIPPFAMYFPVLFFVVKILSVPPGSSATTSSSS